MSKEEVKKILAVMIASYPNYKPNDMQMTVNVWNEMLLDYDYRTVAVALKTYISTDRSGFAPSIGQIIDNIVKVNAPATMGEQEAWSLVRKALENGIYNSQREFDNLPDLVQKAVGSANQLHVWASDPDYDESVMSSNFMRSYRTVCARQEEYNRMPKEARLRIDALAKQALGQKGVEAIEQREPT